MIGARCSVCLGYRRVRLDGRFARHTRGSVGAYCPGSERDASAALAIDALGAEMQRVQGELVAQRERRVCHDRRRG